jgi:putative oxidoreductase
MHDLAYQALFGRVLLGLLFLFSAVTKITDPQGTQQYMTAMGMTWMTTLFYFGAIVVELIGALCLLLGYRSRAGAWLLFLFMIPTTLVFHAHLADQNQLIHFLKNLSIMGGLLYVAGYGAGSLSMDAGLERSDHRDTVTTPRALKTAVHQ